MNSWNLNRSIFMQVCVSALVAVSVFALMSDSAHAARNARPAAAIEAPDPVKDATVNLYCRLKAGKKIMSSSGSGVFVAERGVVLTNAHVAQYFLLAGEKGRVTGWCSVRTGSPAKERYTAEVLYIPAVWLEDNISLISKSSPRSTGENDFALLYITGAKKGTLPARFPTLSWGAVSATTEEEAVTIAGYPVEGLDFDDIRNKLTVVMASSTVSNMLSYGHDRSLDVLSLRASPAGASGVSGGPIVNSSGELIGIVTSKSSAKGSTKNSTQSDSALRAITLSYIDRAISEQTGFSLATLLAGDFAARAALTRAALPPGTISTLMQGLRKKK